MLGVNAVAQCADVGAARPVALRQIQVLHGEAGQIPGQALAQRLRRQLRHSLQNSQLLPDIGFQLRPWPVTPADHADIDVLIVVDDALDIPGQGSLSPVQQAGHKFPVGIHGSQGVFPAQAVQIPAKGADHRVTEQGAENRQGVQPEVQFGQIVHTFRIAPFAPLETSAA